MFLRQTSRASMFTFARMLSELRVALLQEDAGGNSVAVRRTNGCPPAAMDLSWQTAQIDKVD
jgi:hypothetical protein